jgi:hypothetical protein
VDNGCFKEAVSRGDWGGGGREAAAPACLPLQSAGVPENVMRYLISMTKISLCGV